MSTELEQIKKKASGVLGRDVTNGQWSEIVKCIDRAYELGRSERGEKMPVRAYESDRPLEWVWVTDDRFGDDDPKGEFIKFEFPTQEAAIADARAFWARFGVEIEVKE